MKPEFVVPPFYKGNSLLFDSGLAFWLDSIQLMQDLLEQYQNIARMILGHSQIYGVFLPYGQTYFSKNQL